MWDGVAEGAVIGALLAAITTRDAEFTLRGAVIYGGVGFLFDHGHRARSPVYRAPAPTTVAWTVKWE